MKSSTHSPIALTEVVVFLRPSIKIQAESGGLTVRVNAAPKPSPRPIAQA